MTTVKVTGYLPQDTPEFGKMVLLGFQHVLTMFPATVLCALLMHFDVSTVLTITGLGTVVALLGAKFSMGNYIPLYYGSSFSYIAAVTAVVAVMEPDLAFGQVAQASTISVVQAGFICTGLINVIVGLIIRVSGGKEAIDKILPPVVTGSVACVIGIGLGAAALGMASGTCCGVDAAATPDLTIKWWVAALITLLAAVIFSVYLQGKGFIGMLPILLAGIVGYIVALPLGLVNLQIVSNVITAPRLTFPVFNNPLTVTVLVGVGVMAIATIPESTAHLYQISLYVDHLAEELGREKLRLNRYIGLNLMLDGLNDIVNGIFGSTAGTNYGENNSLMVITRNYSGPVLITAGCISILLGFIGPLKDIVNSIPTAVSGGLSIYLFGVIGMQGIALMMAEKVNLYDPGQLAIGATILIVGIGGNIGYPGGFLPVPLLKGVFPYGWPAIATGAVAGILMNLIFLFWKPPVVRGQAGQ
ncbi:MAG: xanthine permease [Anaerolineae bacterium]|nr:xanthine permease [Anaerolineae bacterium]